MIDLQNNESRRNPINDEACAPRELVIAALINLCEDSVLMVNARAGHHPEQPTPSTTSASTPQPSPAPHVGFINKRYSKFATTCVHPSRSGLNDLTIKQRKAAVGVRSSRDRKEDLIHRATKQVGIGGLVHAYGDLL